MSASPSALFKADRFGPLFGTMFFGALNDNFYKTAMGVLIVFHLGLSPGASSLAVTLAAGVFILPFVLFSALAGQLSDGYDKAWVARTIKLAEILIMGLGAAALNGDSVLLLMLVLFLMGTHSTFFGPLKYAILPQHLHKDELLLGNALVEAGTFIAILTGTIAGGLMSPGVAALGVLAVAVIGFLFSLKIPAAPPPAPGLALNLNIPAETAELIRHAGGNRTILLSILGISWFWALGAVIIAQLPAMGAQVIGGGQTVVTALLTCFSLGIGLGSLLVSSLLRGKVSAKAAPVAALAMSVFLIDLWLSLGSYVPPLTDAQIAAAAPGTLIGFFEFAASDGSMRIMLGFLGLAIAGGAFIVPLYTLLQTASDPAERSRTIAANNVVNAAFMVAASLIATVLLAIGVDKPGILLVLGLANFATALVICGLLPETVIKALVKASLRLLYRVEVRGLDHFEKAGTRAVAVVNHVSFLDGLLLAAFLPGKPSFAVNTQIARQWWVKPFLNLVDAYPVDPTNPMSTKSMVEAVKAGRTLVIFPEGRITVTGALMKVFEGPGMVADHADAQIVPIRIDGAQYTPFSRLKGKVRIRWFPKVHITVLEPRKLALDPALQGRARREAAGMRLYDLMAQLIYETCTVDQSLFEALLDARRTHGASHDILEDAERRPLTYRGLIIAARGLGHQFARFSRKGERVGLLMPNSAAAVVSFFALQAYGRVPALLNAGAGSANLEAALNVAEVRQVITARSFVAKAGLAVQVEALAAHARIVYLEDIKADMRAWDSVRAWLGVPIARLLHRRHRLRGSDAAAVLFTSGSEAAPKGVVLSHRNINANRHQIAARIDFNPADTVLNALPMFHAFGLTAATLLPILSGVKTVMYASPLHARIIAALAYDANATILFGTDTFLTAYAEAAHPYDFYALRYVIAGAERVREQTRQCWTDKFGLRILEGYGTTETAPVIAVNTPMHFRAGTVGRPLPMIDIRIDPVEGIETGGRLLVRGPNVMAGYLLADQPGIVQPPPSGWHDTGDIVIQDEDGFLTIVGRAKRFAKIAGEMLSLAAIEQHAERLWPGFAAAAIAIADERRGQRIVLVTTCPSATLEALATAMRAAGAPALMVPDRLIVEDSLPLLASGKTDYPAIEALAR